MARAVRLIAIAAMFIGTAVAEMDSPARLDPACRPLMGLWHQVEPETTRTSKATHVLAVDTFADVTILAYSWDANGDIFGTETRTYLMRCTARANGDLYVEFLAPPDDPSGWFFDATIKRDRFTMKVPASPGIPKPATPYPVYTYKKVFP